MSLPALIVYLTVLVAICLIAVVVYIVVGIIRFLCDKRDVELSLYVRADSHFFWFPVFVAVGANVCILGFLFRCLIKGVC